MMLARLKKIYRFFIKAKPTKVVQIDSFTLTAPRQHQIEHLTKKHKYYSRNLPRIAKYIEEKYPSYNIIDVGANIGDSIALFRLADVHQKVYAFEGEDSFYDLLTQNLPIFKNVEAFKVFLGEETHVEHLAVESQLGTGKLSMGEGRAIQVQKLDDFLKEHPISDIKLLKTDTDGFDFKILRGSRELLARDKPVLFFEYDADYLEALGDDGISFFSELEKLGYSKAFFYDNFGKFLISVAVTQTEIIKQLHAYMRKKEGSFYYYDVCVFHQEDEALSEEVVRKEVRFFHVS
ncbi:MAG: methyltransferase, FkbM family [Sphingobacteriaceae bacterium]|jgi:FkbM family methyltransferase|nr:methyltransferase, FkbM family [Sphingobacteriaceae bacterium]